MKRIVKRSFPFAADGIRVKMTEVGSSIEIKDSLVPGLVAEGYLEPAAGEVYDPKTSLELDPQGLLNPTEVKTSEPVTPPVEKSVNDAVETFSLAVDVFNEVVIEIPDDWKSLKWAALKALAEKIKGTPVGSSQEARSVIEAEIELRKPAVTDKAEEKKE